MIKIDIYIFLRMGEFEPKRIEYILEGVLHIFALYNLLGPGISFYRKSKIIVKIEKIATHT